MRLQYEIVNQKLQTKRFHYFQHVLLCVAYENFVVDDKYRATQKGVVL